MYLNENSDSVVSFGMLNLGCNDPLFGSRGFHTHSELLNGILLKMVVGV